MAQHTCCSCAATSKSQMELWPSVFWDGSIDRPAVSLRDKVLAFGSGFHRSHRKSDGTKPPLKVSFIVQSLSSNSTWFLAVRVPGSPCIANCTRKKPTRCSCSHSFSFSENASHASQQMFRSKGSSSRLVPRVLKKKLQMVVPDAIRVEPGKYSYDVENVINQLSSLTPRASITRYMDSYRNKLSMKDFSLIFRELGQRGDWERALRLFRYMQRQQWCRPHEYIYTIVLGILGREQQLDKCIEIFEEMPNHGVDWDVYSFTALINAYGRSNHYKGSLQVLSRMKEVGVIPNLLTYNTVINACVRGGMDWEDLLGLLSEMKQEGIRPDNITYNTLLGYCSYRGRTEEAKMLFLAMNEAGLDPDKKTYAFLVETFRRGRQLEAVPNVLKEMEMTGNMPDATGYNVLLEAFSQAQDVSGAAGVFKQMVQAGCSPNVQTYCTLLECYGKKGRFDDVRELFTEMKASGTAPDVVTYNTLIQTFGKGGYFREVVSLFYAMGDGMVEPDMETYKGLLHACGMAGLHHEATEIFQHLVRRNLTPEPDIFNGLINAYGKAALYQEAEIALQNMREYNCRADQNTFNSLINVYAKGGLYKEAGIALTNMHKAGFPATVTTYNSFVEAFSRAGLFDDARAVATDMLIAGCDADVETHETFLNMSCLAGLFDQAKAQFVEVKEVGSTPQATSYCLMLSTAARRNRWDDARKLLEEMQTDGMPNLHVIVAGLIQGNFDERSNWHEIVEPAFDSIKVNGIASNMMFYNALLDSLWWSGQKSRAARVFNDARKRGIFPEAFTKTQTIWSIDVHRMSIGAASTTVIVWLEEMQVGMKVPEELPELFTIVTKRTDSSEVDEPEAPVSRAMLSLLESIGAPFKFAPWNEGRIISFKILLSSWLLQNAIPEEFLLDTPLPFMNVFSTNTTTNSPENNMAVV